MANPRRLLSLFDDFSQNLMVTLADVEALKKELDSLLEQNTTLRLENDKLRKRLADLTQEVRQDKQGAAPLVDNLRTIYDDGFHVCNANYGQKRDGECLWCDEILYRE